MAPLFPRVRHGLFIGLLMLATAATAAAQIAVSRSFDSFTPADDAQLGQEAADAVLGHLSPVKDTEVAHFVDKMAARLAGAIPSELQQPVFRYEVDVLNVRDVTSFAFPGGRVFISAPTIELAANEHALAGLLAHELAHVVLRHATLQLSASEQYQIGAITGRQIGLAAAAPMPGILERGASFSIASYFLRFDPAYEAEADLLGARLAETAGYDPAAVSDIFRELKTGAAAHGGLIWLMRHPNHRVDDTDRTPKAPSAEFQAVQTRVASQPRPERSIGNLQPIDAPVGTGGSHAPTPSGEVRTVTTGDQLQLSVPDNWRRLLAGNTVTFAPEGGYIPMRDGPGAITHGLQVGVARSVTGELDGDMRTLLKALARNNPKLTWVPAFQKIRVAGRDAVTTTASHVSPVTRDFEIVIVTALQLSDDSFLYFLGVAPQPEASIYRGAFTAVVESFVVLE